VRAPTPSAAAELVVPEIDALVDDIAQMLDRLARCAHLEIVARRDRLRAFEYRLALRRVDRVIATHREHVARLSAALDIGITRWFTPRRMHMQALIDRLNALDPTKILTRGYAIVMDSNGRCLTESEDIAVGQDIAVRMRDGTIGARVESKNTAKLSRDKR